MNVSDLAEVKLTLNLYSSRIVTFGDEGQQISLLNAADRIGVVVHKTETLSNWAVERLREDQKQYAAMDVVALHYLNVGTRVQWEDNPPRPARRVGAPRFYNWRMTV